MLGLHWGHIKQLPKCWFHIPCIIIVYGTSNGPLNDVGNYLGPCSTEATRVGALWVQALGFTF